MGMKVLEKEVDVRKTHAKKNSRPIHVLKNMAKSDVKKRENWYPSLVRVVNPHGSNIKRTGETQEGQ